MTYRACTQAGVMVVAQKAEIFGDAFLPVWLTIGVMRRALGGDILAVMAAAGSGRGMPPGAEGSSSQ
jgi:hypothetical protein